MTKQREIEKQRETETRASNLEQDARRSSAIGAYLLNVLGRPADFYAVQVRPLWQDHYRVNVLVGASAADVRIAHSYFLVTDGEGNLEWSNPEITGKYAGEVLHAPRIQA